MTFRFGRRCGRWLLPALFMGLAACQPAGNPQTLPENRTTIDDARRSGHTLQALYLVEARASAGGWTPELARQAGDLWAAAGDTSRALDFWGIASREDGESAPLLRALAQVSIELQRWPDAVSALERLAALEPDDRWAQLQLGMIWAAYDVTTAETHLRAALAEPGYEPVARALLGALNEQPEVPAGMKAGLIFVSLELWPYAELAFRHTAETSAPYPAALAYTALARDRQGKPAERWMSEAITLAPDDALVRYLQGLHLRALGDHTGSLDALAQAMALDPENPAYHAELASAYRLVGNLQLAEYWLDSAVSVSDGDPRFADLLAQFYAEEAQHLTDEGVDALAEAALTAGDDADVRAGFGWALYRAGRTEDALVALDAALEAEPQNPRPLYYKGRILVETGELEAGRTLLVQAASGDSSWAEEAQSLLDALP